MLFWAVRGGLRLPRCYAEGGFFPDMSQTFHHGINPLKVLGFWYASRDSQRGGWRDYCLPSEWQYCSQGLVCCILWSVVGELVGRLGTGFCGPNFFPRTGTGAEACRLVKFLFGGLYFKFSFGLIRHTPHLARREYFGGSAPPWFFWCTSPVLLYVLFQCGSVVIFYKAVTCRWEAGKAEWRPV